ncbi:hypothetical protein [Wolbachia endosymbiont of Wuchereria bancrofti]|uniref:hypothetical protein n=1 Tax=Wolbachia endosymbiont of Wuchereria bancrofti TaxID=96496 RepID=UPI000B6F0CE7|nr:hypothetical protein [Wolbachia endosymbiont of Wuchereria bancrofti]OWZ25213.1 hypothetical protein CCY16_00628 [Wolbachia endosymbiont of Wuchereria bancrofti]
MLEKFKYAAREFGKDSTRFDHSVVPKEQQLSIGLGNKKIFGVANKILHWVEHTFKHLFPCYAYLLEIGTEEKEIFGSSLRVRYFTLEEQVEHTKIAHKGRLYVNLMPEMKVIS